MADEKGRPPGGREGQKSGGFLGTLKEALAAASRDDTTAAKSGVKTEPMKAIPPPAASSELPASEADAKNRRDPGAGPSAAEAARDAKITISLAGAKDRPAETDAPPTTRVVRAGPATKESDAPARTQLMRGKQQITRGNFQQDPVVGWLVIVGGPGLGAFRPIFEGNNTIGRSSEQRIPLDFGDTGISSEEQAYIRYDSIERSFLFVPNLSKTNVVSINNKRPTGAVELSGMDVITMGRTQLVFVPFCGSEFDWAELSDGKILP